MTLTQEVLKEYLTYNKNTGIFIRNKTTSHNAQVGDKAGSLCNTGYTEISVKNKKFLAHRLAFLYVTGELPPEQVDHINRIKHDNRWSNLRLTTASQNRFNQGLNKNNTSGYRGVYFDKSRGLFSANIVFQKKRISIGRFETINEAAEAYNIKAKELFGEFYEYNTK